VGYHLARYLHEAGARLVYTDISKSHIERAMREFGGSVIDGEDFYGMDVDVLAPCAVGGIINSHTIPLLKAPIICGGANNILNDEGPDGEALSEKGITYGPDYVVNAGGLINVYSELKRYPREKAMDDAGAIFATTKDIINKAKADGTTTIEAANRLAEARIAMGAGLRAFHLN
ncbi:MAG: leucine dehydrogenase, partial [Myxococcales bacterium]|nr:leucine dehydrogenase [Myxococcales bacterium]